MIWYMHGTCATIPCYTSSQKESIVWCATVFNRNACWGRHIEIMWKIQVFSAWENKETEKSVRQEFNLIAPPPESCTFLAEGMQINQAPFGLTADSCKNQWNTSFFFIFEFFGVLVQCKSKTGIYSRYIGPIFFTHNICATICAIYFSHRDTTFVKFFNEHEHEPQNVTAWWQVHHGAGLEVGLLVDGRDCPVTRSGVEVKTATLQLNPMDRYGQ